MWVCYELIVQGVTLRLQLTPRNLELRNKQVFKMDKRTNKKINDQTVATE